MKLLFEPISLFWKHRDLLYQTTRNEIYARYSGSVFGLTWLIIYPLFFLSVYALIFIFIFKIRFGLFNSNEYVVVIFCGLIPFIGFAEALGMGVTSVTSNSSLIKNTLYPIELIPVKAVLTSQCTQIVGTILLLIAVAFLGKITSWALLLPVILLLQFLFTIGIIWILSSLNVYFRDLQNIINIITLMLMMISPIAYTVDMVPSNLRPILGFNPLYYIIIAHQDCLMLGRFPSGSVFWVLSIMSVISFTVGFWFFTRMKKAFVDNV